MNFVEAVKHANDGASIRRSSEWIFLEKPRDRVAIKVTGSPVSSEKVLCWVDMFGDYVRDFSPTVEHYLAEDWVVCNDYVTTHCAQNIIKEWKEKNKDNFDHDVYSIWKGEGEYDV